ncbi:MAG: GntR family transcriptional regulator [Syntrophobacter sp.]
MKPEAHGSHSRLSEKAYEAIKEYILTSELRDMPPGSRVDEKVLLSQLNMSRTPVREAMNRLVAEGFLQVVPYKGIFIAKKSREEIHSILMVRATLEGMAARLATPNFLTRDFTKMRKIFQPFVNSSLIEQRYEFSNANIQFHEFILERSRCGTLIDMSRSLFDHIKLIRFRTSAFLPRIQSALAQHLELVDIFEKRDPELAERLMRAHIEESAQYIDEWEKDHGDAMGINAR